LNGGATLAKTCKHRVDHQAGEIAAVRPLLPTSADSLALGSFLFRIGLVSPADRRVPPFSISMATFVVGVI
jgi:hypothetical protein